MGYSGPKLVRLQLESGADSHTAPPTVRAVTSLHRAFSFLSTSHSEGGFRAGMAQCGMAQRRVHGQEEPLQGEDLRIETRGMS